MASTTADKTPISLSNLARNNDNMKEYIQGEINKISVTGVIVDDALSNTSKNPVQNKVITEALDEKVNSSDISIVATTGSYNDLSDKPTIPNEVTETTVSGWGFTKNTGTYSKPSGGIPKSDLASSVQTSLGKADTALQQHQSLADYVKTTDSRLSDARTPTAHEHDDRYYTESEIDTKLNTKLNVSLKGAVNGLAELDTSGKVPSFQLPSYVDDVLEYTNQSSFPTTGESGKIYIAQDTNKTYRWSGSAYVEISPSLALGETSATAYRGDKGKVAYEHSQSTHAPTDAQANVIETIKVNGTTLTPNLKAVDITVPNVVDNLTSTDTTKSLSANQGKVLKDLVDGKATKSHTHSDYALKSKYGNTFISLGRKPDTTVGGYSIAAGQLTTASGMGSHAEGGYTTASKDCAHAEGWLSTASGNNAHAEGYNTTASGDSSHTEGRDTIASGNYSHAGGYYTNALNDYEVAYGTYNQSNSDTLFSVGDGTADDARHNAIEVTKTGGKLHDKDIATTDLIPTTLPANGGNAKTVNNHTVESDVPADAKFTWRDVVDNLTSTDATKSLSANQGKVLKGLVDGKAASSHNQASNTITAMTGYTKASSVAAISTSDSLNTAIGKLEKALDTKGTSNLTIGTTASTAAAGNHTHNYLPLTGGVVTGTIALKPASGEGGQLELDASSANTSQNGIILDQYNGNFRIFGKASADGTSVTGTGTTLYINPYNKTISGDYYFNGTTQYSNILKSAVSSNVGTDKVNKYYYIGSYLTASNSWLSITTRMAFFDGANFSNSGDITISARHDGTNNKWSKAKIYVQSISGDWKNTFHLIEVSSTELQLWVQIKSSDFWSPTLFYIYGNRLTLPSTPSAVYDTLPEGTDHVGECPFYGNLAGNASTANKLATARTISLTGSVTGSGSFDGSGNLSIATTTNHSHTKKYTVSISASESWTNGTNCKYITKTVTGLKTTDDINISPVLSTSDHAAAALQLEAYKCILNGNIVISANDTITIYCYESTPTTTLTLDLITIE